MTTFVNEQVKKLNSVLTQSFEKSLQEKSSIKDFSSLNDKDRFLFDATQALDLSGDKVQQYLERYNNEYQVSALEADPSLEWLFVAKCTIAIYGQVFSNVLNLTLPISESIDYWEDIHGNTFSEIYYALQIAPVRIYSLFRNIVRELYTNTIAVNDIKSLFTSSDYILSQLFPVHNRNNTQTTDKKSFHVFKYFNLSSFHQRPLILEILRDEIYLKKKSLQQFRSEQAASLGVLLLTPPQFTYENSADLTKVISKETKNCIEMMKYVWEPSAKKSEKNVHHLQKQLSTMDLSSQSVRQLTRELEQLSKTWSSSYHQRSQSIQSLYGTPSRLTRYWIPVSITYFVGVRAIRYGFERKEDIIHGVQELGKTAHDFVLNWIWEPMLKVYNTIRLKDQRLSLLSKEGLQSDLNSLERMVVGFARDNLHLSDQDLSRIASNVREGDISILLKEYEKEIKNPLRNAITGDLLQTMLIQVQKTKVDVDLAMSALDKLLKSNELNFAFLAVAPSMLLTWASVSWLKNTVQGRSKQKMQKVGIPMRETLRRIERQLILNEPSNKNTDEKAQHQIECETQGILLCEIHLLRAYAGSLPLYNSTRARFLEDIRDLENPALSNEQKIQTIARMNRFWSFL